MDRAGQPTERVFAPAYLWAFRCDGAACESRCCRGWRIPVDAAARERFASLPQKSRDTIFSKLVEKESGWETAHGENGDCAFLCGDWLCQLQKEHGEACLPGICDSYPRVSYRFSAFVERSLALTCPVAARLALLPAEPMRFAERTVPARRVTALDRPSAEALRNEENFRALQLRMIAILQERAFPLRNRFLHLGRFLAAIESRFGNEIPGDAGLAACAEEGKRGENPRARPPSVARFRYLAELFAALYEAEENYTSPRLGALAALLAEREATDEAALHETHGHILEHLAVNELFLRLYPFSCAGGFLANFKLFALRFRVAEFSLLLQAAKQSAPQDANGILRMLGLVMGKLDHNRTADSLLKRRAVEDFDGMGPDEALSLL